MAGPSIENARENQGNARLRYGVISETKQRYLSHQFSDTPRKSKSST
jgi:hypothetical protein